MQAGNPGAMSVIPAHARLVGTVRTFRPKTQDMIEQRLTELVGSIAAAFGARAELQYERVYPPTINHDADARFVGDVAESLVGAENVLRNLEPSMGAEDFSFMLQAKPGAFARLRRAAPTMAASCGSRYDWRQRDSARRGIARRSRTRDARQRLTGNVRIRAAFAPITPNPRKFLHAARLRSLPVERFCPAARGAAGAHSGRRRARRSGARSMLLLTSAMHGVEGFCGSGCQVALLRDPMAHATLVDSGVAVVLYHAVNPYGFSHLRRVNEDNVDVNRNFRDFNQPIARNDGYASVHAVVVPEEWPPTRANSEALAASAARYGLGGLQTIITSGRRFPDGVFAQGARRCGATRCCVTCCNATAHIGARLAGSTSAPASVVGAGENLFRPQRRRDVASGRGMEATSRRSTMGRRRPLLTGVASQAA